VEAGASHTIIAGRTIASLKTARAEIMALYPETIVTSVPANVGFKDSITVVWKQINDTGVIVDVLITMVE
jgi:uncharacterized protein YkvS